MADFGAFVAAIDAYVASQSGAKGNPTAQSASQSSALRIIQHCATLAHVAAVKGAVSEPLWRDVIGVLKHTIEGDAICHEWSKGDPRYDPVETQAKINNWKTGPTLCATIKANPDAKCDGCSLTCRSPISLGLPDDSNTTAGAIASYNARFFVARIGGDVFVFDERDEAIIRDGMTFNAFKQFHAGHRVSGEPFAGKWLNSPSRRSYDRIVFDPTGHAQPGEYNIWRGLAVQPAKGNVAIIFRHIYEVWCGRDIAQFKYVIRWLALLVQKPWIKPEVALVLRAKEGAGKTIITSLLLEIFGVHAYTAEKKDQVAGRFNGHLVDKVLVILEEAFFAGDPGAVAAAKALVTNKTLGYEAKGKDAFSARNYAHVIFLANNEWVVPAGPDARRWMVLDVNEDRIGDYAHFQTLAKAIENDGAAAFLYSLLKVDLDSFNPRVLPQTRAIEAQRRETLLHNDPVASWWMDVLADGAFANKGVSIDWNKEITAEAMQESYHHATSRCRNPPMWGVAAKRLRDLAPAGLTKIRRSNQFGGRTHHYLLPDLDEARRHFLAKTGVDPCAA